MTKGIRKPDNGTKPKEAGSDVVVTSNDEYSKINI